MDQAARAKKIAELIDGGTLADHPTPYDAVSGPEPCLVCGQTGGKVRFQGSHVMLCHDCVGVWRQQIKNTTG